MQVTFDLSLTAIEGEAVLTDHDRARGVSILIDHNIEGESILTYLDIEGRPSLLNMVEWEAVVLTEHDRARSRGCPSSLITI